MTDFRARTAGKEDLPAIAELFEQVFESPLDPELWRWKYADHPGETRNFVTADEGDGGRIVRHVGMRRWPLCVDGEPAAVHDVLDSMATPHARRRTWSDEQEAIFAFHHADPEARFTFGITHVPLMTAGVRDRGWRVGRRVDHFGKSPLDAAPPGVALPASITVADGPPEGWDARWAELAPRLGVVRRRTTADLVHRYANRPGKRYRFVADRGATAVAVIDGPGDDGVAHLMELIGDPDDPAALGRTVLAAERVAAADGATGLLAWFPRWSAPAQALEASGFAHGEDATFALFVIVMSEGMTPERVEDGFVYSLGDWDVP